VAQCGNGTLDQVHRTIVPVHEKGINLNRALPQASNRKHHHLRSTLPSPSAHSFLPIPIRNKLDCSLRYIN